MCLVQVRTTVQRHRGEKSVVWCRRNRWVGKPSPEYKLNIVPSSGVGVDSRVGVESSTEMERSEDAVRNREFDARALGS